MPLGEVAMASNDCVARFYTPCKIGDRYAHHLKPGKAKARTDPNLANELTGEALTRIMSSPPRSRGQAAAEPSDESD